MPDFHICNAPRRPRGDGAVETSERPASIHGRPVIAVDLVGGWRIATKFPVDAWTAAEAKAVCLAIGGTFKAAADQDLESKFGVLVGGVVVPVGGPGPPSSSPTPRPGA